MKLSEFAHRSVKIIAKGVCVCVCVCVCERERERERAKLAMHVLRNTVALSHNVIPPRVSRQRDNISLEEKIFMAI